MRLSETSIRRPVLATVMSLLLVLIGLVSFNRLTVREYPRIDEPVVNVDTRLLGASSEVIESQVTKPLEDSIAGITYRAQPNHRSLQAQQRPRYRSGRGS
jgi:multidrug efflux pump